MNFNEKYQKIKTYTSEEISIIEQKILSSVSLQEPYCSALKGFLSAPSKRIRIVLPVLYIKAFSKSLNDAQAEVLSVVEMVHNASLIHDDIIDKSDLRRGNKTISCEFGNKSGVILGDYILSLALEKLCNIGNIKVIEKFAQTIRQMCIGEVNQNHSRYKIGTLEEYIEKTKNKTAYLFETALLTCTMLDDSNSYNQESISRLGLNTGIAFQIRDDLLNMSNTDLSKPVQSDIEDGIYNAPIILGNKEDNYALGIEKTKDLLNNYVNRAKEELKLLPNNNFKILLEEFLELLNNV